MIYSKKIVFFHKLLKIVLIFLIKIKGLGIYAPQIILIFFYKNVNAILGKNQ